MIDLPIPVPPTCTQLNSYGGYATNMRGFLGYTPNLDKLDNPGMIPALEDVYKLTTTRKDFLAKKRLSGKECLPNGIAVVESGFTHNPRTGTSNVENVERALKEKKDAAYNPRAKITACCTLPPSCQTENKESYIPYTCSCDAPNDRPEFNIGIMESGFTRNTQPNPTDGRVLDPIYAGQMPVLGKFGPSVTHLDFPRPHFLSGKEPNQPFSRKSNKHSGFWQERTVPPCYVKGAHKNWCCPTEDYVTSYRLDYPRRWCDSDYSAATIVGEPMITPGVKATINLFQGKGYYISETMEMFTEPPKKRVQLYPFMVVKNEVSPFPKAGICPPKGDCPDDKMTCACAVKAPCRSVCPTTKNCPY